MIHRTFKYLDEKMLLSLYKCQVRTILEYSVTIWYPQLQRDLHSIKEVQRQMTKLVPRLKDMSYPERLKHLKVTSMTYRWYRGDMIHVWKLRTDGFDVDEASFFKQTTTDTRGHSKKFFKPSQRSDLQKNFFSHQVIQPWNDLPEEVVNAPTINAFKNALDRAWASKGFLYNYEETYG